MKVSKEKAIVSQSLSSQPQIEGERGRLRSRRDGQKKEQERGKEEKRRQAEMVQEETE